MLLWEVFISNSFILINIIFIYSSIWGTKVWNWSEMYLVFA
jgi:hypothetical protein